MLRGSGRPRAAWCVSRDAVYSQDSAVSRCCELEVRLAAMQQPEEQGGTTGTDIAHVADLTAHEGKLGKQRACAAQGGQLLPLLGDWHSVEPAARTRDKQACVCACCKEMYVTCF